ncbi:MAG: site-specific integrase, partial [Clostridia bacterium]|nr:site-specific integrase [Clostridia bacterium]
LLFMFIGAGMREGELFGLYKEDFDYKNRVINVCRQFTNYEQKTMPKTSSSIRKVYLFPLLADLLKEHIDKDKIDTPLVFHNSLGKHLHPSNVRQRWWNKLLKLAGYKDYYARMHDLRGSNTDISFALGLSVSFAQEQLGHSSATTTLNKYARRNQQMIDEGMRKFEEAFTKKCEQNVSNNEQMTKSNILDFSKFKRSKG